MLTATTTIFTMLLAVTLTLVLGPPASASASASASAAEAVSTPTATTVTAPQQLVLRRPVTVTAHVEPLTTGVVRFEQLTASGWTPIGDGALDAAGDAAVQARFDVNPVSLRASYLGADGFDPSTSAVVTTTGSAQQSTATLGAPRSVVDERTLRLTTRVVTADAAVPGAAVTFQVFRDKKWRTFADARTDVAGSAVAEYRPRTTYRYRALVAAGDWFTGATTATVTVANVPPGKVVKLPRAAPRPKKIAAQARASGDGAHATVSTISSSVWRSMTGRSWRAGCPVGRSQLRLVRVNYWGFDGYRHRGELVVNRSISAKTARAFTDLYRHRVPIRSMYRIDRFGYSSRVKGGNDYASMAADNTSAFNCRNVVGRAGVRSPHATGRAIDINPFENPYRYRYGKWVPNTWWHSRSAGSYAWTKRSHLVPTIMRRNGFRWTYGNIDGQHFDG